MFEKRVIAFSSLCVLAFLLLIGRFLYLQILRDEELYKIAKSIKTRVKFYPPERGNIYTADGVLVATNVKSMDILIFPLELKGKIPPEIKEIFGEDKVKEIKRAKKYYPVTLMEDINYQNLAEILPVIPSIPHISFEMINKRFYPFRTFAAHVIGHTKTEKYYEYVGISGVEKTYDKFLKGKPSRKIVEINAIGKEIRTVDFIPGEKGKDITLTILYPLQVYAEEIMKDKEGAVIVMNPHNGEIFAMVSSPYYDINAFSRNVDEETWIQLINDPRKPFLNRAISAEYPPGSIFKILMAIAGLEEKVINQNETVKCRGIFYLGKEKFRCWKKYGHGDVSLYKAIVQSCDVFFYNLGLKLGVDKIYKWAKKFGLGEKTGIDLPAEAKGLIPSTKWKEKTFKEKWYPGETVPLSIGQGYIKLTPIQLARFISAVVNGGYLVTPHVVKKIGEKELKFEKRKIEGISPETFDFVKRAMVGVVEEGTARRSKIQGIKYGGKTGTAQVVSLSVIEEKLGKPIDKIKEEEIPKEFRDHALFAAFAPADNPQIVVVAVVEHSGAGSKYAAPVVKALIEKYISLKDQFQQTMSSLP